MKTKKIMTGAALIISGYGIVNAVKTSADETKKKKVQPTPNAGTGKSKAYIIPNIILTANHGVPVDKVVVGTPATGQSPDIGEAIKKQKMIKSNTAAMDSP